MRNRILFLAVLFSVLLSSVAMVAWGKSVQSDSLDPRATHCGWVWDGGTKTDVPVLVLGTNKVCNYVIDSIAVGSHTVTATAVAIDPAQPAAWQRIESPPSAPFTFVRPAVPSVPSGFAMVAGKVTSAPVAAAVTHCGWQLDSTPRQDLPVVMSGTNKVCTYDPASAPVGSHTLTATAIVADPYWGRLESGSSVPFAFERPTLPVAPTGIRLVP